VQVGRVEVLSPAPQLALAIGLGERADRAVTWPGLGSRDPRPLRLFVVPDEAAFRRLGRGTVPAWGVGLAIPGVRAIAIRADAPDPAGTLRHELAHLALRDAVRGRLPLWFDEGYAVVAAGEWDRFDALQLNLAVARGRIGDLRMLDAALRRSESEAATAYALAGSAVLYLARRNPARTLDALLARLEGGTGFDEAVLATTGLDPGGFEEAWQRDVRGRYNLLVWLVAGGGWGLLAVVVIVLALSRRRRDRPRRAALDVGWPDPGDPDPAEGISLDHDRPAG
jgi:hypothetical protein